MRLGFSATLLTCGLQLFPRLQMRYVSLMLSPDDVRNTLLSMCLVLSYAACYSAMPTSHGHVVLAYSHVVLAWEQVGYFCVITIF